MIDITTIKLGDYVEVYYITKEDCSALNWNHSPEDFIQLHKNKKLLTISLKVIGCSKDKIFVDGDAINKIYGGTWTFTEEMINYYNPIIFDQSYKNKDAFYVKPLSVMINNSNGFSYSEPGGCKCDRCKEFIPYAAPNQANGTMKCFSCRANPYR